MGNSFATYLARQREPIRYALDPAHEQAIRNYIRLHLRGGDYDNALSSLNGAHVPIHAASRGLLDQLAPQVLGEHNPESLQVYLDAMQDFGGPPGNTPFTGSNRPREQWSEHGLPYLINLLHGIHRGHGLLPNLQRGYTPSRVFQEIGAMYREPTGYGRSLADHLRDLPGFLEGIREDDPSLSFHQELGDIRKAQRSLRGAADPRVVSNMYDLGTRLGSHPGLNHADQTMGSDLQHHSSEFLRRSVLPYLDSVSS